MSKLLKSKYNNSGDRCVDACLSYGELRYLDNEGQPINIEVPEDKYEEAIIDFTERKKEGLVSSSIDPIKVLKKGSFTYNQVKNIANLNKIKGLRVFEIDGSIELEHTLGVSGSIEYALAIWNGDSKEVALEKAIIRAIKIHGVNFVKSLKLDEKYESIYDKVAKLGSIAENQLYTIKYCKIQDEIYSNIVDMRINLKRGSDIAIGSIGSLIGFILVQLFTNFGKLLNNIFIHVGISIFIMILFYILSIKLVKAISYNYIKNTNGSIIDMFNDELEYYMTILFYNGGAKLTCEESPTLEDLKSLEAQGVEILTCGTCLNHYGLTDKLQVGSVTNMYVIAEKMTQAGNIVKP